MKSGLVVAGPDVAYGPLALLTGTFAEKLSKATQLGYNGIELMVRDPAGLDWASLKASVEAAGLEVPQLVTGELYGADGLCLVTADSLLSRRAEDRLRSVVDLAAYLKSMVNIGRVRGRLELLGEVSNPWETAVARLRPVMAYAAERGVRVAIEPINRYETDFIHTAADGMRLIADLGYANVGLMLDLFHMNIEEPSIEDGLRLAADRLWHVHIADSGRRFPGSGHLDFDRIFAALEEANYEGYVSAEVLPLPDADAAAERTIAFLGARIAVRDRILPA